MNTGEVYWRQKSPERGGEKREDVHGLVFKEMRGQDRRGAKKRKESQSIQLYIYFFFLLLNKFQLPLTEYFDYHGLDE